MEWVKPGINIDFMGKRHLAAAVSASLVLISIVLAVGGSLIDGFPFAPKYGVDFAGGTLIQIEVREGIGVSDVREGLRAVGMADDSVQSFGASGREFLIRVASVNFGADEFFDRAKQQLETDYGKEAWKAFEWTRGQSVTMRAVAHETKDRAELQGKLAALEDGVTVTESKVEHNAWDVSYPGLADQVKEALGGVLEPGTDGTPAFEVVRVETVGATVGAELRNKGLLAIFFSLALILVYVGFRFDLSFAPGAVVALFHDVAITIGVFCVFGREFTLPTIGALLTIIGYSINDTIVVYDRIRENLRRFPRRDLSEVINLSLNETLARTTLTALTTLFAVLALLFLGGPIVFDLSLALAVGIVVGTYSSIYVATPLVLALQRWLPIQTAQPASGKGAEA